MDFNSDVDAFETGGFDESIWDVTGGFGPEVPSAPEAEDTNYLSGLNPEQHEAVHATEGPVLVVAGAGTGKTRVLTTRITHIIRSGLAEPDQILAVTFTNKAAAEMRERIGKMVGDKARRIRMGSFHSVSLLMLRHHPRAAGLRNDRFVVLDDADQLHLIDDIVRDSGFDPEKIAGKSANKKAASKIWKDFVRKIHARIMSWKEEGWSLEVIEDHIDPYDEMDARALPIYRAYQEALLVRNACDFPDLLLHMVRLFRDEPEIKKFWADRFRYVLVDEFQDTNALQYEWLEHLARGHGNICVVGDPDQSLYEWRGARPDLLNNFANDWPGTKIVTVDRNYRSTQEILDVANAVVLANPRPAPKRLRSAVSGDPVRFEMFDTHWDEATAVAREIRQLVNNGHDPDEIAILFRSSGPMRAFEEQIVRQQLPYTVVGGMKFHEREEVKDAHAYLRLALDPRDEFAFLRVVNKPTRNVGEASAQQVVEAYRRGQKNFIEACRDVAANGKRMRQTTKAGLEEFAKLLEEFVDMAENATRTGDLIEAIMTRVGYIAWRIACEDDKIQEREESLKELIRDANQYSDPGTYLQTVATLSAADIKNSDKAIRISTIHAAKGLEFETVYTPCLEEGVLPNARALKEDYGLGEERRVAHVAWTRAKKNLIVTCAQSRYYEMATPSQFLFDVGLIDADTGLPVKRVDRARSDNKAAPSSLTVRRSSMMRR
jgi:DNA helicase-2/ATP-dependent DNA helicase PcrA